MARNKWRRDVELIATIGKNIVQRKSSSDKAPCMEPFSRSKISFSLYVNLNHFVVYAIVY